MCCFIPLEFFGYFNLFYTRLNLPLEMSGGSCHISAIRVFLSRAEAIAHKASIVFELINSGSAVFTQILHSFFAKSIRIPSTRCGLKQSLCYGFINIKFYAGWSVLSSTKNICTPNLKLYTRLIDSCHFSCLILGWQPQLIDV